jgi:fructose-1,6-bisphosphatase/sedoheptulose 1,7-bisphosphatase-like protein
VSNVVVAPNAELSTDEIETLKKSLAEVSSIAMAAHEAVVAERERHQSEIDELRNEQQK